MKRLTWFIGGMATGAAGASYAKRKVQRAAAQLAPANVARSAGTAIKHRGHDLVDAVREGREAMRAKEAELLARRDGHAVVDLDVVERTFVVPDNIEPGQLIVLRDVLAERDAAPRRKRRSAR
jgi:hypothetical protein